MIRSAVLVSIVIYLHGFVPAQSSVDKLNALYKEAWDYSLLPRPLDKKPVKDDPRLPDVSIEAQEKRNTYWKDVLHQLNTVDASQLSGDDRINYDVFRYIVEDNVAAFTYKTYLTPFTAEGGFHTEFGMLPSTLPFVTRFDYENYLVKLNSFPEYVDQHIDLLRLGIASGYTMPAVIMQDFEQTALAYVKTPEEGSIFFAPFENFPNGACDTTSLVKNGRRAVYEKVIPAYEKLANFLRDEYIPACRKSIGATNLPDGTAFYQQRVEYFTTKEITPAEVFEIGKEEVARIRKKMEAIIDSLHFNGTFAEFLHFLRTDPRFYAKTPHELLAEASYFSKRIDGLLPQYFGKLPRLSYGVTPVPEEIAVRYTGGRYSPGSYTDHRAGQYWVNTYKLESRPLYVLPALTLHEAVPGHHLQISLAAEANMEREVPLPEFRNSYYISAYGEGWALYCEWLGHEMGIYEDLYQKFGALTYEMWRACRLVVDPGMHAMGWSRDEAVNFMAENTALSLHEVNTEIDRYIGWPGQALSYKIGELHIKSLRKKCLTAIGPGYSLRGFHDMILENGSVPLFVLERITDDWIHEQKK